MTNLHTARFDVCVIGAGMVGSAAAKYCAILGKNRKLKILLIGPEEPDKTAYDRTEIFGAHYDEGRITRCLDTDPLWACLSIASIKRYSQIEQESGTKFYVENGFLRILDKGDPNFVNCSQLALKNRVNFSKFHDDFELREKFPFLNPLMNSVGLHESSNAGSINPRRLVKAQKILAARYGAILLADVVVDLNRGIGVFNVKTAKNGNFTAEKVILCVGAYLYHYPLLPPSVVGVKKLNVKCGLISTVRIPVNPNTVGKLSAMPTVVLVTKRHYQNLDSVQDDSFYMMPPILYPDGKYYLKLGFHSHARKGNYGSPEEITDWYRNGDSLTKENRKKLCQIAQRFVPDLDFNDNEVISDTCAIVETPHDRPYVDELASNLFIVTGCNGYSAKSSDEFGRLVARLSVDNVWDCPISRDEFKCQFRESKL